MLAEIGLGAGGGALVLDQLQFGWRIAQKPVDADQHRQAELGKVLDVAQQVGQAALDRTQVFLVERLLVGAAVQLQRPDRCHDHGEFGLQSGLPAFDVEEFLRAKIGAEACFGHDIVGKRQRRPRGEYRIAAVRDVGEWPAVDQDGIVLQRLDQVGLGCVLQHCRHRRGCFEIARRHRLAVACFRHDDAGQALFEIGEITREAEDRHHLRRRGDVEARLAGKAVGDAAEARHHVTQGPVVHVEHARPEHAPAVDAQRIAPVDMVVEHRREQVVRRGDGVEVAGEMQVDLGHRHDLRLAAAGGAALLAEAGSEAGLAQRDRRLLAEPAERIAQSDRRRGLALARLGRIDGRHQDQLAGLAAFQRFHEAGVEFGLVAAVRLERIGWNIQARGDVVHRLLDGAPRDLDI